MTAAVGPNVPTFDVVQDPVTGDYTVVGEDPPVASLGRFGHFVYRRSAAVLEREAYERLTLAGIYRRAADVMLENGE